MCKNIKLLWPSTSCRYLVDDTVKEKHETVDFQWHNYVGVSLKHTHTYVIDIPTNISKKHVYRKPTSFVRPNRTFYENWNSDIHGQNLKSPEDKRNNWSTMIANKIKVNNYNLNGSLDKIFFLFDKNKALLCFEFSAFFDRSHYFSK